MRFLTPTSPEVAGPPIRAYVGWAEPDEVRVREPLHAILADVAAVEILYPPPPQWMAVRDRWTAYLELATPHADALAHRLVDGPDGSADLRALALAELAASRDADAELRQLLAAPVHAELTRLWQPHAVKAFKVVGEAFNTAAANGDTSQLDQAATMLAAAARLCGAAPNVAPWAVSRQQLGLCVDPGNAHLRKLAGAFTGPDRWTAVVALGARLRAATNPLREYPELPALLVCVDRQRVVRRWDPLDGDMPQGLQRVDDGWVG
jgi:hypothetical protein